MTAPLGMAAICTDVLENCSAGSTPCPAQGSVNSRAHKDAVFTLKIRLWFISVPEGGVHVTSSRMVSLGRRTPNPPYPPPSKQACDCNPLGHPQTTPSSRPPLSPVSSASIRRKASLISSWVTSSAMAWTDKYDGTRTKAKRCASKDLFVIRTCLHIVWSTKQLPKFSSGGSKYKSFVVSVPTRVVHTGSS